jgi:hypothetical protein
MEFENRGRWKETHIYPGIQHVSTGRVAFLEMEKNNLFVVSPEFGGILSKRGFYWRKLWKRRWVSIYVLYPIMIFHDDR